jgi:hypothetical protein
MKRLLAAAAVACTLADVAGAREVWRRGEVVLDVSGSVFEFVSVTQGTDLDRFADQAAADPANCVLAANFENCLAFDTVGDWFAPTSLTRLRTRFDLEVGEHWSFYAVYDHELRAGRLETFGGSLGESISTSNLLGLDNEIAGNDHVRWRHLIYRGYVRFESEHVEATLGRQRIPWGVGRLWNPIDRFNPIPPLAIQQDQSGGVDAIDLHWLFSGFTFLEAVYAPLKNPDDSAYALRLHGVARDVDYSVVFGIFEEAWTAGFDLAGNVLDAAARAEVVYTNPERNVWPIGKSRPRELDDFWQIVVSIDYLFDLGNGVYALVEYLYNGNALGFGRGKAGPLLPFFEATSAVAFGLPAGAPPVVTFTNEDRFGGSRVITRSRHLSGLQLGYDLTPELRADVIAIVDWDGGSASFFPSVAYSPLDWLEVRLGAQFFVGPHRSEYGNIDPLGFLTFEAFF